MLLRTRGGTRTRTSLRTLDFESSASTNSATLAILSCPPLLRECKFKLFYKSTYKPTHLNLLTTNYSPLTVDHSLGLLSEEAHDVQSISQYQEPQDKCEAYIRGVFHKLITGLPAGDHLIQKEYHMPSI